MENRMVIFEDDKYGNFYPLAYLRPIYSLRPGIRTLAEKIIDGFSGYKPTLFCRPEIENLVLETSIYPVNKFDSPKFDELIFINGRLKIDKEFTDALKSAGKNAFIMSDGNLAAIKIIGGFTPEELADLNRGELGELANKLQKRSELLELDLKFYNYLWDFVTAIDSAIIDDFEFLRKQTSSQIDALQKMILNNSIKEKFPGVHFIKQENIYISSDAEILPGVVLDAEKGPIFIGGRARIEPHSYIIGPTYIGKESIIVGGRISGSSIGTVCRIGGELEESIIQGYTNKYHAGFIGHSYIGEWVNFGAMTTNSDLKNNYGSVKVAVNGKEIDTGYLKVGSFIGDFTKTAIGTLLNTGINIGISCNILADGLVAEKEIPSFTWLSSRHKMEYRFNKALDVIERTMSRRNKILSESLKKRLEELSHVKVQLKLE